jgi:predicted O-methyltransferase YrrM
MGENVRRYPREFLTGLPAALGPARPPAQTDELDVALEARRAFLLPGEPEPYMNDIVRAFRLVRGCRRYVEVGTYDKGNLAYVAGLLAPDAVIVDVDYEARPERTAQLKRQLGIGQRLHTVVGDSMAEATREQVMAALDGRPADVVFIDANHTAFAVMADYALYSQVVRPGGLILFHDVYWAGDERYLGSATALQQIDRFSPVWVVLGADEPVHRFLPYMTRETVWGGVGIIQNENV